MMKKGLQSMANMPPEQIASVSFVCMMSIILSCFAQT